MNFWRKRKIKKLINKIERRGTRVLALQFENNPLEFADRPGTYAVVRYETGGKEYARAAGFETFRGTNAACDYHLVRVLEALLTGLELTDLTKGKS